jgi:DNA-directed RNA polymerase specialized sigma subunit
VTDIEQLRDDIKSRLELYRDLIRDELRIQEEMKLLEGTPAGPSLDGLPRGSGGGNAVESLVEKRLELHRAYSVLLEDMERAAAEIEHMIARLEITERLLIRCRYLMGMSWEQVCDKIHYSWTQTHRIHRSALDHLAAAELERRAHDA